VLNHDFSRKFGHSRRSSDQRSAGPSWRYRNTLMSSHYARHLLASFPCYERYLFRRAASFFIKLMARMESGDGCESQPEASILVDKRLASITAYELDFAGELHCLAPFISYYFCEADRYSEKLF
jgi:hypothetical protein